MKCSNPIAFRPGPVTFWTTLIYIAIALPVIWVHETVPLAPSEESLPNGISLNDAWRDLQHITEHYHPYNSHDNDRVRQYLFDRSEEILGENDASYAVEYATHNISWTQQEHEYADDTRVTIFDDLRSNSTMTEPARTVVGTDKGVSKRKNVGKYFEGTNYYVYIRGTDDPPGKWWNEKDRYDLARRPGAVLVNCHYDSVSTGYGATDDGMACVSMLQLLSYFTHEKNDPPKHGVILLFNNAEEDGLYGARAFGGSPVNDFCRTFVNLEGAGAGGRAMLFRATDIEVAQAYAQSPHPFGSIMAADAFKRGLIKSGTDYQVFNDVYGHRGLDIAFYEPRSRYHTIEDDARHTSRESIWHILSAALASTRSLSRSTGTHFTGDRSDHDKNKVQNGKRTEGVYFDMFGSSWVTFPLEGLFAWTLTLLVATPLILVPVAYMLARQDKLYFFARDIKIHSELNDDPVRIGGWKGFSRFPIAFVFAAGLTFLCAFLVAKVNPLIVYSSSYASWAMYISLFYSVFWLISRGASIVRPSALHRGFTTLWLFIMGWAFQVFSAIIEDRMKVGAFFPMAFLQTAAFLALLISLWEQFSLPGKRDFAQRQHDDHQARDQTAQEGGDRQQAQPQSYEDDEGSDGPGTPSETTPLRAGDTGYGSNNRTTFGDTYRRSVSSPEAISKPERPRQPYGSEQSWSGMLPTWTWIIQFLLLAPVPLIIIGNLSLVGTSSTNMTGVDGGPVGVPLMLQAGMAVLMLLPLTPFLHRVTHHVPVVLMLIFIVTLVHNLTVFPFSTGKRFKFYFQQVIDLDSNSNTVNITGIEPFIQSVIGHLPTAGGRTPTCRSSSVRGGLHTCAFDASAQPPVLADDVALDKLITFSAFKETNNRAKFTVNAANTRACRLEFDSNRVAEFWVEGGADRDDRLGHLPNEGLGRLELFRRDWLQPWNVTVGWKTGKDSSAEEEIVVDALLDSIDGHGQWTAAVKSLFVLLGEKVRAKPHSMAAPIASALYDRGFDESTRSLTNEVGDEDLKSMTLSIIDQLIEENDIDLAEEVTVALRDVTRYNDVKNHFDDKSIDELKLRDTSDVDTAFGAGTEVKVTCLWSDANKPSTIPAYTELLKYAPTWAVASKTSVGLVEVSKRFSIPA